MMAKVPKEVRTKVKEKAESQKERLARVRKVMADEIVRQKVRMVLRPVVLEFASTAGRLDTWPKTVQKRVRAKASCEVSPRRGRRRHLL